MRTERDDLFGTLALHAGLVDESQLADARSALAGAQNAALADVLVERGWLTPEDRAHIERLLESKHRKLPIETHASLAGAGIVESTLSPGSVADPETPGGRDEPTAPAGTVPETVANDPAHRGRYRLLRPHAKGGIGQVWLAYDADLGREVALKELREESLGHPTTMARFVEEARITGQLEHPSIVPVYELTGSSAEEAPYYTMRFIHGRTLSDAVRRYHELRKNGEARPPALRELLGAFVSVCNAVAYAHSRGVVHRDLKGANVVLGDFGEVILLDWGLAKSIVSSRPSPRQPQNSPAPLTEPAQTNQDLSEMRELTVQGQVLGTPAFMAPEQAEGRLDLIDERTDVYGLGAILYEILTGHAPFVGADMVSVIMRVINETPMSPRQCVAGTPAPLAAICLRALEKKREDRYASAAGLGRDVQQFLADEPVWAFAEPWRTRVGRWARRHRTVVSAAVVLLLATVTASLLGMVFLGRANRQIADQKNLAVQSSAEAQEQRRVAELSRDQAQEAERRANKSAATAQAINDFLVDDLLGKAAPEKNARSKQVTVEEVVRRAAAQLDDKRFADQPEVEGSVRDTIGRTLYLLGSYTLAEEHLRKAMAIRRQTLGADNAATLDTIIALGELLWAKGEMEQGLAYIRESLEGCRRTLGPDHKKTLTALNNYALLLQQLGRITEVEPLFRQQLESRRRVLGPHHPYSLNSMNNLARCLLDQGKPAEAEAILREALADCRRVLPDDPMICAIMSNLGVALTERGNVIEAEPQLHEALAACIRIQGPEHPYTLITQNNIARLLIRQNKMVEAEPACRENLERCRRVFGPEHPKTLLAMDNLAAVLVERNKLEELRPLLSEGLAIRRKVLPSGHYEIATSLSAVGAYLLKTGKPQEGEPLLREAWELRRKALPDGDRRTAAAASLLGGALTELGRCADAEPLLLSSYEALGAASGVATGQLTDARARIVKLYETWGKPAEAARWRDQKEKSAARP